MIVVILASIFILYHSFKNIDSFKGLTLIIVLRILILFFLIILIFNPKYEYTGSENVKLPWHIYVDNSLSMRYHKYPSAISYKKGVQSFLNKIKKKGVHYEAFSFSSYLDTIRNFSNIELNANSTNMGFIFDQINDNYQNNVAGIVIFTDGQVNQGPPIQQFHTNNKIPIHIIGVGETTPMQDVSIKSVNIPPLCVKGENVNIDVLVNSLGSLNERVNVTLFDDNNKLIGSKIISVTGNQINENVRFQISPNKIGENKFLVKCSALPEEINITNNQQKITLHVMKDEYNIALVTGAPSYNTKILKNYFLKAGNNSVDHFVIDNNNFNQKIKLFLEKKYEVIIFDNNPVDSNAKKWKSIARVFAKKLLSHNSSFFIVPGPEIDVKSLNSYLKIIDLKAKPNGRDQIKDKRWQFSKPWYRLNSINEKYNYSNNSKSNPPQNPAFQFLNFLDDEKAITYANYISHEENDPLLILGEKQLVRYAVWNSTDLHALKYKLIESDFDFLFNSSIKRITNWLMKKSDNGEFIFRTDKNSYQHGESVSLYGINSDKNNDYKINEGIVELYHQNQYLGAKQLFFDLNENIYRSKFWASKPGKIDYVIKINNGLESYEVSSGSFIIQESHIELNRIFLNRNKLINLSNASGGSFRSWADHEDIITSIQDVKKQEAYTANIAFRYNYFYLCFIIILLYVDWFYRKKIGLN